MDILTASELKSELVRNDDIKVICIIQDHTNHRDAVAYVSDTLFTTPYRFICTDENIKMIRDTVPNGVLLYVFSDLDLTLAWRESYMRAGIFEDRWDRRAVFHRFDVPNECFCVDQLLYDYLTDYWKGTEREGNLPKWMMYVIDWYKLHSF